MPDDIEFKDMGLGNLAKAFKAGELPVAKLGILGSHDQREGTGPTNAAIGAKHEYGIDVPVRSWLRAPVIENMQKYLEKSGLFDKATMEKEIASGSLREVVAKIGITGEAIVADGFDSGGFGKWKPSNMKYKKNAQTLVETQQLRNAVTSEVT